MAKKESIPMPAVGGSSLLVIFAVLCLTIFALLALSTAQAGQRLSLASADAVAAYYEADCRAEEIFARLRGGKLPEGVAKSDNHYSFTVHVTESRQLAVTLQNDGESWTVLRWQAVSTLDWVPDDSLPVFGSDTLH